MRNKKAEWPFLKGALATVLLVGLVYLASNFYGKPFNQWQTRSTASNAKAQENIETAQALTNNPELPSRLKIPALNIDSAVEYVGLASDGSMDVPSNAVNVAWYNLASRPGDTGSAVIAGHLNGKHGEKGVFAHLGKLQVGDKVYVEDVQGATVTFVVREIRIYDPGYADEVFSQSDTAHLNLITCGGLWDTAQKSYSKRLVVFTDRE